jgi:exodeoxyribonuclease-3
MQVASWNVNSLRVRLPQVLAWLGERQPDVLALQETKIVDEDFPVAAFHAAGYQVVFSGQKTYNGVAIVSKVPAAELISSMPGWDDEQRRFVAASFDGLRVVDVYVPNGESVGSEKYHYKLRWLKALTTFLRGELERYPRLLLLGDFNIAPDDRDVHDPLAWQGGILCSAAERAALAELLALGLQDTFRLFPQPEGVFSWWDYRMAGFRRNLGLRIDLILASAELARRCCLSGVDKAPRALDRPSDHAPVMAQFDCRPRCGDVAG